MASSPAEIPPAAGDAAAQVNPNPQLQSYYNTLESRVGYRLLLGGTRHFGFWDHDTHWPFPLSRSLRKMEDKMAEALSLPRGSHVLDAGCGVGHVALRMAKTHGLSVSAIDVVPHHVAKAQRNFTSQAKSLPKGTTVTVRHADYHHLDFLPPESLDGVYTMETLVHATDPESVLAGFYRVLKPGGHIALFEYDHSFPSGLDPLSLSLTTDPSPPSPADPDSKIATQLQKVNLYSAMPTNARSHPGVFKAMLEDAGFEAVEVRDFSENIKPMTRLFYALAVVPYWFVKAFGAEKRFVNTVAGVGSWRGRERWRYVAISAVKPELENETEAEPGPRPEVKVERGEEGDLAVFEGEETTEGKRGVVVVAVAEVEETPELGEGGAESESPVAELKTEKDTQQEVEVEAKKRGKEEAEKEGEEEAAETEHQLGVKTVEGG